ncbi:MAG: hypothetical protein ABSF48_18145 [Thermodesulfobacteriota bacterium]
MEDIRPGFYASAQPGDFIVAGKNSGCGSSREYAPKIIKARGGRDSGQNLCPHFLPERDQFRVAPGRVRYRPDQKYGKFQLRDEGAKKTHKES